MSWRIVTVASNSKLDLKQGFLVIRAADTIKVHLSEIAILVIESTAISLTAALLCELNKRSIKVVFCDEKRNPYGELVPYCNPHNSTERIRNQIEWSGRIKGEVWKRIIMRKIQMQSLVLKKTGHDDASRKLNEYASDVEFNDQTNREGHAAKVYFNVLFGKDFTRREDDVINSCLNYGYAVILSAINREIGIAGYLTQLGLFHDNKFNSYNLGSDLMEPLRPFVDELIVDMLPIKFSTDEKRVIASVLNKNVVIDGKTSILLNSIRVYVGSVFSSIQDNVPDSILFCDYES